MDATVSLTLPLVMRARAPRQVIGGRAALTLRRPQRSCMYSRMTAVAHHSVSLARVQLYTVESIV